MSDFLCVVGSRCLYSVEHNELFTKWQDALGSRCGAGESKLYHCPILELGPHFKLQTLYRGDVEPTVAMSPTKDAIAIVRGNVIGDQPMCSVARLLLEEFAKNGSIDWDLYEGTFSAIVFDSKRNAGLAWVDHAATLSLYFADL